MKIPPIYSWSLVIYLTACFSALADLTPSPTATTQPLPTAPQPANTNAAPGDTPTPIDGATKDEAKSLDNNIAPWAKRATISVLA